MIAMENKGTQCFGGKTEEPSDSVLAAEHYKLLLNRKDAKMKPSKNKHQFQLYVYRPGFKDLGNVHVFPTLVAMTKNQKTLEGRGFMTEMMRNGKLFDPDKIQRSKEKRDFEKRAKLMDILLGTTGTSVEQQLNFAIPAVNVRAGRIITGSAVGDQYPNCSQEAIEAPKTDVVSKHWPRGLTPHSAPVDELPYIETSD
jgi:hypothetical protein